MKWDKITNAVIEARKSKIPIKAFFLYVKRGDPLAVIDTKEVPVTLLKAESRSGPIFRWGYPKERYSDYYPPNNENIRYGGTALIHKTLSEQPLGMSLHYAYWMGVDFGLSVGVNISLWLDDSGQINYKACYVHAAKTNGGIHRMHCETFLTK